jgi:hypothetical protein
LSLVFVVSCKYRPLRRGDHSSRLIVPSVCVCVRARAPRPIRHPRARSCVLEIGLLHSDFSLFFSGPSAVR